MSCLCSGAFGALAGDDLTAAGAHASAAAPSLAAVPERGVEYRRPRQGTGAFGALAGGRAAPTRKAPAFGGMGMQGISE